MPDLSPEEREALELVHSAWLCDESLDEAETPDFVVALVLAALAAVPRLREVEGMFLAGAYQWHVRYPDGTTESRNDAVAARTYADLLNNDVGPGHHAVRLAVVEVATPTEEGET